MQKEQVENAVRTWVSSVVVGLNLCPFAKRELDADRVRFSTTDQRSEEGLLEALQFELAFLTGNTGVETTLLIHPFVLQDFFDYNQFLDLADRLLIEMNLDGVYQIASFHPSYQFGGTHAQDAENFTNRSPYPMLHLLREESLERAIAGYRDIDQVPQRNIERMNNMGSDQLRTLLHACFEKNPGTTD
ncbi:MAG: DUF1415 domain-containing protein [Woeseiaceae bacterium]